jgi:hypothetical protein
LVGLPLDFSSTGPHGRRARPSLGSSSGPLPQLGPAPRGGNPRPVSGPAACVHASSAPAAPRARVESMRFDPAQLCALQRPAHADSDFKPGLPTSAPAPSSTPRRTRGRPRWRDRSSHRANTEYGKACPRRIRTSAPASGGRSGHQEPGGCLPTVPYLKACSATASAFAHECRRSVVGKECARHCAKLTHNGGRGRRAHVVYAPLTRHSSAEQSEGILSAGPEVRSLLLGPFAHRTLGPHHGERIHKHRRNHFRR